MLNDNTAGGGVAATATKDEFAAKADKPYRGDRNAGKSSFDPLARKGIPLAKQAEPWRTLTEYQYNKHEVHPYTRCRIIAMNGVEVAAAIFKHNMARRVPNDELRQKLAMTRRIEQQQQKKINGMIPYDEHTLEVTLGYEQVAVDLTAWLARNEPDPYVQAALDFALLEDFDHLYRYANILDLRANGNYMKPEQVVGQWTEVMPGRPTAVEHCHPLDGVRRWADFTTAAPQTMMNILTIVAAEQQTMNFYMTVNNRPSEESLRGLYSEIGMIEEQHVTHYESLMDPTCSWLKMAVMHELHECYLYHSFSLQEVDPRVKRVWESHLEMEIGHLHDAISMFKQYTGKDPEEFIPMTVPEPTAFESNIDYVRQVIEAETSLTGNDTDYTDVHDLPSNHRYFAWRSEVNGDWIPSNEAVRQHIEAQGEDYRFATAEHPIPAYRDRTQTSGDYPA